MLLIVDTVKRNAEAISDILYYMGIISMAATPTEALSEVSPAYKAVIICEPEHLPDAEDFARSLRAYQSTVSLFAISKNEIATEIRGLFARCFASSSYSSTMVSEITEVLKERGMATPGTYRLAGIDASCDLGCVSALGTAVPLTKTEVMILRYLIASYPIPKKPEQILKYCFRHNRQPEASSIRTHISIINKKFREATGRRAVISVPQMGYAIATPELLGSLLVSKDCAEVN